MKTRRKIKIVLVGVGISVLMTIGLFVNPQAIYYNYKAEEQMMDVAHSLVERAEEKIKKTDIEIEYLGGSVYSVQTASNEYLIKKTEDSGSNITYSFFYEPSFLK